MIYKKRIINPEIPSRLIQISARHRSKIFQILHLSSDKDVAQVRCNNFCQLVQPLALPASLCEWWLSYIPLLQLLLFYTCYLFLITVITNSILLSDADAFRSNVVCTSVNQHINKHIVTFFCSFNLIG